MMEVLAIAFYVLMYVAFPLYLGWDSMLFLERWPVLSVVMSSGVFIALFIVGAACRLIWK